MPGRYVMDRQMVLKILEERNDKQIVSFMGVDIQEFTKEELIKILSFQSGYKSKIVPVYYDQ
jgi:hypothetical protein